jgi:hypothetical protein
LRRVAPAGYGFGQHGIHLIASAGVECQRDFSGEALALGGDTRFVVCIPERIPSKLQAREQREDHRAGLEKYDTLGLGHGSPRQPRRS